MNNLRFSGKFEKIKIDKKDLTLMKKLSSDSRTPLTKLTKSLGLSRDSINYRINRLKKAEIIQRFYPSIDFERYGYKPYHLFMILDERSQDKHTALLDYLKNHPATRRLTKYSDRWDIGWTILAKDLSEFDKIHTELNEKFSELILNKMVLATISKYLISGSPYLTKPEIEEIRNEELELDETDNKLLHLLAQDARTNAIQLGHKLKLSSDAVIYRIKRLKKAGVIKYFTTLFDLSRLGYNLYTYCISFTSLNKKQQAKLNTFINRQHNIINAEKTFGDYDLVLQIAAETPTEFHKLIREIKISFADIIKSYDAWIAHKETYDVFPEVLE